MNLHCRPNRSRQRGASLIAAVFLITALAVLGVFLSRVTVTTSRETVNEFYSAQALYAAESGIDLAAWNLAQNVGNVGNSTVNASIANTAVDAASWVTTTTITLVIPTDPAETVYQITSIGTAGGTMANPLVRRTLVVHFKP